MVHIFVVAEDAEILSAVRHILQVDEGVHVLALSDSQAALRPLTDIRPDLILLDREVIYREGLGLPVRLQRVYSVPVLLLTRSDKTQILTKNHFSKNGLISRIQKALARAGIHLFSPSVIL